MTAYAPKPRARIGCRAFTTVEAIFSVVLVGGLLVVALDTVGASAVAQRGVERRTAAQVCAAELMSEVMVKAYEDPDETPTFGPEVSDVGGPRIKFDDLDDFAGWSESPAQLSDGTTMSAADCTGCYCPGWRRVVAVQRVDPDDCQTPSLLDTGIRKVTVSVWFDNEKLVYLTAVRFGKSSLQVLPEPPALEQ
jgi:hypothetical protein